MLDANNVDTMAEAQAAIDAFVADPSKKVPLLRFRRGQKHRGKISLSRGGKSSILPIVIDSYGVGTGKAELGCMEEITSWTSVGTNIYEATTSAEASKLCISGVEQKIASLTEDYIPAEQYNTSGTLVVPSVNTSVIGATIRCRVKQFGEDASIATAWNGTTKTITLASPYNPAPDTKQGDFFVEIYGKKEFLTQQHTSQGDYVCYEEGGVHKVRMYSTVDPSLLDVTVAVVDNVIDLANNQVSYLKINDVAISGARYNGVNLTGSGASTQDLTITNTAFSHCAKGGISLYGGSTNRNAKLTNLHFDRCGFAINVAQHLDCELGNILTTEMSKYGYEVSLRQSEHAVFAYNHSIKMQGYLLDGNGEVTPHNLNVHDIIMDDFGMGGLSVQGVNVTVRRGIFSNGCKNGTDMSAVYAFSHASEDTAFIQRTKDLLIEDLLIKGIHGKAAGHPYGDAGVDDTNCIYLDNGIKGVTLRRVRAYNSSGAALMINWLTRDVAVEDFFSMDMHVHVREQEKASGTGTLDRGHSYTDMTHVSTKGGQIAYQVKNSGTQALSLSQRNNVRLYSIADGNLYQTVLNGTQTNYGFSQSVGANLESPSTIRKTIDQEVTPGDNHLFYGGFEEVNSINSGEQLTFLDGTKGTSMDIPQGGSRMFVRQDGTLIEVAIDNPTYTVSYTSSGAIEGDPAGTEIATLTTNAIGPLTWALSGANAANYSLTNQTEQSITIQSVNTLQQGELNGTVDLYDGDGNLVVAGVTFSLVIPGSLPAGITKRVIGNITTSDTQYQDASASTILASLTTSSPQTLTDIYGQNSGLTVQKLTYIGARASADGYSGTPPLDPAVAPPISQICRLADNVNQISYRVKGANTAKSYRVYVFGYTTAAATNNMPANAVVNGVSKTFEGKVLSGYRTFDVSGVDTIDVGVIATSDQQAPFNFFIIDELVDGGNQAQASTFPMTAPYTLA